MMNQQPENNDKQPNYTGIKLFNAESPYQINVLKDVEKKAGADGFAKTVEMLNRLSHSKFFDVIVLRARHYNLDQRAEMSAKVFIPLLEEAERLSGNTEVFSVAESKREFENSLQEIKEVDDELMYVLAVWEELLDNDLDKDFEFLAALAVVNLYRRSMEKSWLRDSNCHTPDVFSNAKKMIYAETEEAEKVFIRHESFTENNANEQSFLLIAVTLEMMTIIYDSANFRKTQRPAGNGNPNLN